MAKSVKKAARDLIRLMRQQAPMQGPHLYWLDGVYAQDRGVRPWADLGHAPQSLGDCFYAALDELDAALIRKGMKP